jgi:hypothetical protein
MSKCYVALKDGIEGFAWSENAKWYFKADGEDKGYLCNKEELVLLQLVPNC